MTHSSLKVFFLTLVLLCHLLRGLCGTPETLQYGRELLLLFRDSGTGSLDGSAVFQRIFSGMLIQRIPAPVGLLGDPDQER